MSEKIEQITNDSPESKSLDIEPKNIEQLKQLFPDVFREGKVDFEALKSVLGEHVEDNEERYNFTWHGKNKARQIAQTPSTGTLRPCKDESVNWDTTKNIFVEGDNLEVLKLLQKSYHKKVKMIYIDPPYNTGKDFVYKDNFHDNISNYLELTNQTDSDGHRVSSNSDTSGRYHTDWLNMMYPRLKLARNLLKDDGAIFISIDDYEYFNLKKICDEIFGEDNFIANIVWQRAFAPKNDAKYLSENHDYILVYAKNASQFDAGRLDRTAEANARYKNYDNDPRGNWISDNLTVKTYSEKYDYPISTPGGRVVHPSHGSCWRVSQEKLKELIDDNRIWFGPEGNNVPRLKRFLSEVQGGMVATTLWLHKDVGHNQKGRQEVKELFDGKGYFDGPKPVSLISRMLRIANVKEEDTILDFFAGSSTSADAVIQSNIKEEIELHFIMVQLPELCPPKSEASKAGFKTIAEISKERIRRAGVKAQTEYPNSKGDIGFKILKLAETNISQWEAGFDNISDIIEASVDSIKEDRTSEDVLYEILLKYGLDLTYPITEHTLADKTVYDVAFGSLIVCLDDGITRELVESIGKLSQELGSETTRVVFKDSGFDDDAVKVNAIQLLKQYGVDDVKSI